METELIETHEVADANSSLMLIKMAIDNKADPSVIEKLMDLRDREDKRNGQKQFDDAMVAVRKQIAEINWTPDCHVNHKGGGVKYRYLSLPKLVSILDPICVAHGIYYCFDECVEEEKCVTTIGELSVTMQVMTCIIRGGGGGEMRVQRRAPIDFGGKDDKRMNIAQAFGATTSYNRRYLLMSAFGIVCGEDTDANGLSPTDADGGRAYQNAAGANVPPAAATSFQQKDCFYNNADEAKRRVAGEMGIGKLPRERLIAWTERATEVSDKSKKEFYSQDVDAIAKQMTKAAIDMGLAPEATQPPSAPDPFVSAATDAEIRLKFAKVVKTLIDENGGDNKRGRGWIANIATAAIIASKNMPPDTALHMTVADMKSFIDMNGIDRQFYIQGALAADNKQERKGNE